MGTENSEDDPVTQINVEVDPSLISEITITATGVSPITVSADSALPADNEPSTLEPQLVVRGLGPPASTLAPVPPTFAEVGTRPGSEADDYDVEEERTTQNIESNLREVYDRAARAKTSSPPVTQLSPIALTPSEPMRVDVLRAAGAGAAGAGPKPARRPAPIPAAGRPPEPVWEKELTDVTTKGGPESVSAEDIEELRRIHAPPSGEYEDETVTNAVSSELAAVVSRAQAKTVPVAIKEAPEIEKEETRTAKAPVVTMASAQLPFLDAKARRELIAAEQASSTASLDAQAGAGGTVRMFYDPATGKAVAHPDSDRNQLAASRHPQPFGELPTIQALPLQQHASMAPPGIVRNQVSPAALPTAVVRRKRGRTGIVLLFFVACAGTGVGVYYRSQLTPWVMAHLPNASSAPAESAAPSPPIPASAAEPAAAPSASASADPAAVAAPATSASAPASASAAASTSTSASASAASASAAASAAASARNNKNKRPPPSRR